MKREKVYCKVLKADVYKDTKGCLDYTCETCPDTKKPVVKKTDKDKSIYRKKPSTPKYKPCKDEASVHPGKGFSPLFPAEPDYYKTKTYEEVFKAVGEQFRKNFYKFTFSADELNLQSDAPEYLTKTLKLLVSVCPDLFESDNPSARKLVAHFGRLVNTLMYPQNPEERKKAKDTFNIILSGNAKWRKKYIQPLLSPNDMVTYIHQITEYLRKQYIEEYGYEPLNKKDIKDPEELEKLKKTDQRLVTLVKSGYVKMLIEEPKELTKKLVADFLGLALGGLKQQLKEKNSIPIPST